VLIAFAWLLYIVLTGKSRIFFLIQITVLFLIAHCCCIISAYFWTKSLKIESTDEDVLGWNYIELKRSALITSVSTFFRDSSFALAHWIFAFKYW